MMTSMIRLLSASLLIYLLATTYAYPAIEFPDGRAVQSASSSSVLASGYWQKISIPKSGMYTLSAAKLASMGFPEPQKVKIYGNKPGMLSLLVDEISYDDLIEIAADRSSDGITFFASGPTTWAFDSLTMMFLPNPHAYSDYQHYFITASDEAAKPVSTTNSSSGTTSLIIQSFDDYQYTDPNDTNLLKSGRLWVGDEFNVKTTRDYTFNFDTPLSSPIVRFKLHVLAHSTASSFFSVTQSGDSVLIPQVSLGPESTYAYEGTIVNEFESGSPAVTIQVNYHKTSSVGKGWLNNLIVNVERNLAYAGNQFCFRSTKAISASQPIRYEISGWNNSLQIWDVTDFANPFKINPITSGTTAWFQVNEAGLREYTVFEPSTSYTIADNKDVPNQNLHAAAVPDMIIIAKELYRDYANELALLHQLQDNLDILVAPEEAVFNEFSSGNPDICAYRNMIKYFYDKGLDAQDTMKYVLFYGDVSYDNRMNFESRDNYLLSYQSANSTNPISSVFTDDFFGYMEPGEGDFVGDVDLGIGRLPVNNENQALIVLNKIKSYYKSFGNWRNTIALIADDPDSEFSNQHMDQAESIAAYLQNEASDYNLQKIYLDAFPQEVTASGERYPDVITAINNQVNKGALIVNYTGHGNEIGLSHERVITTDYIQAWNNGEKLPFFVTATCEFSRMDDHNRTSGGEYVFLNENGGGIALLTTTRSVYYNSALNTNIYKYAFEKINGEYPRLGDIIRLAKIFSSSTTEVNIKKYNLIGDPAIRLAYPMLKVVADSINHQEITALSDTFGALSFITVSGYISDAHGAIQNDYNGVLFPTIYDKMQTEYTLGNEGEDLFPFSIRSNILYKGKASITNGRFSFSFYIPKDISYLAGYGKLSFYATDNTTDGMGSAYFMVGGANPDYVQDFDGPGLKLFMNDTSFQDYGITNENPVLLAHVFDESGINTVGIGIGHDISGILDRDQQHGIVLNDYYESDLDSYQSGMIKYPLYDLAEGEHVMLVKVWDIQNNSSIDSIHFIVSNSEEFVLETLKNYPNPFATSTSFYMEHNQADQQLNIRLSVFDTNGRLVKQLEGDYFSNGYSVGPIEWDGTNYNGQILASGVYLYRIELSTPDGKQATKSDRLVIIRN